MAQRTYQCNIQIDQTGDPMRITVAGQPGTIDAAASAVTEIINGGNPFGMGGPASLGGASQGLGIEWVWGLRVEVWLGIVECGVVIEKRYHRRENGNGGGLQRRGCNVTSRTYVILCCRRTCLRCRAGLWLWV